MKPISSYPTRIIAGLIDWFIPFGLTLALFTSLSASDRIDILLNQALYISITLLTVPICLNLLQAYLTGKYGGSIGKLISGLAVVDENEHFLTLPKSLFRSFIGPVISGPLLYLGYIWILLDRNHQGWHDMAIGTTVVETKPDGKTPGLITLIILLIISGLLVSTIYTNFKSNSGMYQNLFQDISQEYEKYQELKKITPTPTPLIPSTVF
jgi:uncharacterized RDD family membrane protein YckC